MPNEKPNKIPVSDEGSAKGRFWGAIDMFFNDLATLDVVTMTGNLKLEVKQIKGFQDILGAIEGQSETLWPVAVSHHEIDYDAALFVKDNLSDSEKDLLKTHLETVKAAHDMRDKVVDMAIKALKLLA